MSSELEEVKQLTMSLDPAGGKVFLMTGVVADRQKLMREAYFGEVPPQRQDKKKGWAG
jgi:hypothetical protein